MGGKKITGTVLVNNVPNYAACGTGYMVVTNDNGKLWFYGFYDEERIAWEAVKENDNRFIVKVDG